MQFMLFGNSFLFTIIYNCHHQCTLGYFLSLLSVLAKFLTKDILIYFSTTITMVLPWTQTPSPAVLLSVLTPSHDYCGIYFNSYPNAADIPWNSWYYHQSYPHAGLYFLARIRGMAHPKSTSASSSLSVSGGGFWYHVKCETTKWYNAKWKVKWMCEIVVFNEMVKWRWLTVDGNGGCHGLLEIARTTHCQRQKHCRRRPGDPMGRTKFH